MTTTPAADSRPRFRFEDLEVWQRAADLAVELHGLAGALERRRHLRAAELIRAAGLSLANQLAEATAGAAPRDFQRGLLRARGLLHQLASLLLVLRRMEIVTDDEVAALWEDCDLLGRKTTALGRALESGPAGSAATGAPVMAAAGTRRSSRNPPPARP